MNKKTEMNQETGEFIEVEVVKDNLPIDISIEPIVTMTLPVIRFNYIELKQMMTKGLEEYKIEVTSENIAEAKKLATKLNKLAKTISDTRIAKKKEILAPVDIFEIEMKDLTDTAKMGREFITSQVKVFEDAQSRLCEIKCNEYLNKKIEELFIEEEFREIDISDLFKPSNITDSLNLKKPCRDTMDARLNMQLTKQTNKKMRLMQLENECYKADLKVMLNESDVASFILEDDLAYNAKLSELIVREQNKQKQIELNYELEQQKKRDKELKDLEFEKKKEEFRLQEENRKVEFEKEVEIKKVQEINEKIGTKRVTITATFETEVSLHITDESVLNKFKTKLKQDFPSFKYAKI